MTTTALEYNEERNYSRDQIRMIQRTVGVDADGILGPVTIGGIETWQRGQGLSADGKVGPQTLVAIFKDALKNSPGLFPIQTVGAWAGTHALNPKHLEADVQFCVDHGINRLDVVVNDYSDKRSPQSFGLYRGRRDEIIRLCKTARAAGIEPHLMSWAMPHAGFIEGAAEQLIPLCEEAEAASLMWDAEEAWNQATERTLSFAEAADLVKTSFAKLSCPMGATGIVYTDVDEFGPLARVCEYVVPQCYATRSGKVKPETIVSRGVERWRSKMSLPGDASFVIGLAGYRQDGIPGHTVESAMMACLENVRAYAMDTVIYWSLYQIQSEPEVAKVIASIRGTAERPSDATS